MFFCFTLMQNEHWHSCILEASRKGTSMRHNLQSNGGFSGTGTKLPVLAFSEYFEPEAKLSKLEHLEHIRDSELFGDILSRLTGKIGSMLLLEEDDRRTFARARTVSHFLRLA